MASWSQNLGDQCFILMRAKLKGRAVTNLTPTTLLFQPDSIASERTTTTSSDSAQLGTPITELKACETSRFIMNGILLTLVFLLGLVSAVLITLWSTDIIVVNSGKRTFQALPQLEHLQLRDELGYMGENGANPFGIDPDGECDGDNPLGLELEAATSIHAALEMKEQGKLIKAQKLFKHAMAICPRHADVLTHYGEFFEIQNDYLMADHLYVQALAYAPEHRKALSNRKRTMPVVEEIDEKRLKRIDDKKDLLVQMPESNNALRRVKKEAYFQHLYHTAGIEGNTMTLSQTRMIVETRMAVGGKSLVEHNEILGLDAAMKFINSSLVNRIGAITIEEILEVHRHVMSYVDPSEAGHFRKTQVYVGSHVPPPPGEIPKLMEQLVEWLNSEDALALHPIHYSAILHYKLVYIHPFIDGNGRSSRLLMNWVLMQAGYPPVIIRKQDRHVYYEHLNTANKGDVRPFIRFIADCTEKTVDVYLWATHELDQYHIVGPGSGADGGELDNETDKKTIRTDPQESVKPDSTTTIDKRESDVLDAGT